MSDRNTDQTTEGRSTEITDQRAVPASAPDTFRGIPVDLIDNAPPEEFPVERGRFYNIVKAPGFMEALLSGLTVGTLSSVAKWRRSHNVLKSMDWGMGGFVVTFAVVWAGVRYKFFLDQEITRATMEMQERKIVRPVTENPRYANVEKKD